MFLAFLAHDPLAGTLMLLALLAPAKAFAQLPDKEMLNTLRDRLLEPSDAYPHAAEMPSVDLKVTDGTLSMNVEVHAAIKVAVPLPGKLPAWSPLSVKVDGAPESVLRRDDGCLWVVVPAGVHQVSVEGLLPAATEWEWTFRLKPRRVTITAPGWTVTGVRPNGVPENQVFFARQRKAAAGEAEYDRKDFNAIVVVNRHLDVGLVWLVRNVVTRLSSPGKAISLRIPLLAGEKVLTSGVIVEGGFVEVRLGAGRKRVRLGKRTAGGPETRAESRPDRPLGRMLVSRDFAGLECVADRPGADLREQRAEPRPGLASVAGGECHAFVQQTRGGERRHDHGATRQP
jgi:hypothetical protein